MQQNYKLIALVAVVLIAATAGAYYIGSSQTEKRLAAQAPKPQAAPPKGHPATAQPGHPPASQDREGKVQVKADQAFTHFRVGNKNVKSIFSDGKVMWVGTSGGVVRYDTETQDYKLFDARNGLLSNGIFYVGKLNGRIAVGTYGGGLSLLDPATQGWETFNVPDGLGDAFVYDALHASNGDIWIATWSGANRIRGGNLKDRSKWDIFTVENTKGGLPNDWVYGLAEGKNGDIWFATEGGLARFRAGQWENWNHAKGLGAPYEKVKDNIQFKSDPSQVSTHHAKQKQEMGLQKIDVAYNPNYIVSMKVDREGAVWVGTWGGGLSRYDGAKWTSFTTAEGLPGNHVFMLYIDPKERIWVGTNSGLALYRNGKFETLTVADGLFNDTVFSMTTAVDGTMWVGSYGGVAHLRRTRLK